MSHVVYIASNLFHEGGDFPHGTSVVLASPTEHTAQYDDYHHEYHCHQSTS